MRREVSEDVDLNLRLHCDYPCMRENINLWGFTRRVQDSVFLEDSDHLSVPGPYLCLDFLLAQADGDFK
jgi:hypothetical protein